MRGIVLVVLAGCAAEGQGGRAGQEGAVGATGPAGPQGPGGGGWRWVSADGQLVGFGSTPTHVDAQGYLWPLSHETGSVDEAAMPSLYRFAYASPDCQGTEYAFGLVVASTGAFLLPPPRIVMSGSAHEDPAALYVRPDDLPTTPVEVRSAKSTAADDCYDADVLIDAVPMSELLTVAPLSTTWVGPLHPEVAL